ncbi:YicC family protein [Lottiidibacillus patelloidae]|uniref:YicC family protein n=1 Tax=Lottiidibacillus patelloidae TaxID=2670334 RepID=A0A263BXT3_9BACI|nr:YicC/YloC family endoribonuclease [Lottiidibacillus patelloidae]OZM58539.1 YicC family protein [Lottiidibacillus patelloidae]
MINSMTGYGRAIKKVNNTTFTTEVKTVNHRFCDVSVKMPKEFLFLEELIKKTVQEKLHRGRIEVYITIDSQVGCEKQVNLNTSLLEQYLQLIKNAAKENDLSGELTIDQLLHIPDLFSISEKEEDITLYQEAILDAITNATLSCLEMRMEEGKSLEKDLSSRILIIEETISTIQQFAPVVIDHYRERVKQKIIEFIGSDMQVDEHRLLTEVAIFAEKADVSEELTRLKSHCEQFIKIISGSGVVGRKLDFLVQEMNREANTIGSKANDYRISQNVVLLKSELEKIKEQVQNIE